MQNAKPCSMCGGGDHVDWKCPELVAPIRQEGMMKPPAGQPMGGDDEDSVRLQAMDQAMVQAKGSCVIYLQEQDSLCAISMPPIQLLPVC